MKMYITSAFAVTLTLWVYYNLLQSKLQPFADNQ